MSRRVIVLAAALIGAAAAALLLPLRTALAVRTQPGGELRFGAAMADGEELVISYVHSVNRRPIHDTLRVEGTELRILTSRFDAFGAGVPDDPEHPLRVTSDGWMEYTVDRRVPEVTLFVGRVAEHTLRVGSRVVPLAAIAEPGSALRFTVERLSLLHLWRRG